MLQEEPLKKRILWEAIWFWVAAVSAYDLYRCVLDGEVFVEFEVNPIVRAIIAWSGGDISFFVGLKSLGTTVTLASLIRLKKFKHVWFIMWSLAAVQLLVVASYCPWLGLFG